MKPIPLSLCPVAGKERPGHKQEEFRHVHKQDEDGCRLGGCRDPVPFRLRCHRRRGQQQRGGDIKIGVLEDASGDYSNVGQQKIAAAKLAVKEINDAGGLLGKQVVASYPDAQSNNDVYTQMAKKLILEDKVDAIFGGYTSASREAIRPLMDKYKMLYFYNNQYEGGVADKQTFDFGATPEQQIPTLIKPMIEKFGKKVYVIAADYNFGQISTQWVEKSVSEDGGQIVGKEMIPLSVSQYSATIDRIKQAKPDFLVTLLVGNNQSAFYSQWAKEGESNLPMASTVNIVQGYEHLRFPKPTMADMYVTTNYIQELDDDIPDAKTFADNVKAQGDNLPYVGQEAEAEYNGIKLWAEAVKKAGTVDKDKVIAALESGITYNSPTGPVTVDGATHQLTQNIYLVHTDQDQNIVYDEEIKQVVPDWMSKEKGVDLRVKSENSVYTPSN